MHLPYLTQKLDKDYAPTLAFVTMSERSSTALGIGLAGFFLGGLVGLVGRAGLFQASSTHDYVITVLVAGALIGLLGSICGFIWKDGGERIFNAILEFLSYAFRF